MPEPRERPLIFSAPKVQYILGLPVGATFQTRRVVKPQPPALVAELAQILDTEWWKPCWSRLLLEVVEVRVQRLQEISEEDAAAEGAPGPYPTFDAGEIGEGGPHTYHHGFAEAWDRINRKRAPWASNPWVWAYTLRKLEQPRG